MVGSGQFFVPRVWSGQPSMVWVWKIFPKNVKFLNFFPLDKKITLGWVKKYTGQRWSVSYLLRVRSKFGSGWVRAHLYFICSIPNVR